MDSNDVTQSIFRKLRRSKDKKEFDALNPEHLSCLSDKDLAEWHAKQSPDSPQSILGGNEWQRRITMRQVRAAYHSAFIGVAGTLAGALAGVALGWWLSEAAKDRSNREPQIQKQADVTHPNRTPEPRLGAPVVQPMIAPKEPQPNATDRSATPSNDDKQIRDTHTNSSRCQ